jgi:hypothetical protein
MSRSIRLRTQLRATLLGVVPALLLPGVTLAQGDEVGPGHPSKQPLQAQATNPNAPLIQFNVFNTSGPTNSEGESWANLIIIQPFIPVKPLRWFPIAQIMRPSVPILTTPGPNRVTGLGDIAFFDVLVPDHYSWGSWGIGAAFVFPSATDDKLGAGKWQLGPAFTLLFQGIPNVQLGVIVQNPISFAGDSDRPDVNQMLIQPIAQYNFPKGWYASIGDFTWSFDWENGGAPTIPLALQVGRVVKIGGLVWNLAMEGEYTVANAGGAPIWSLRFGVSLLIPE